MPRHSLSRSVLLLSAFGFAAPVSAEVPLHQRIDQAIAAAQPDFAKLAAPPASDAEFLRRVSLDLTGSIPSAEALRTFLADATANKRQQLVDRLLADPAYARHMANVFDVMLLERRSGLARRGGNRGGTPAEPWREYLRTSFAANKPWDQLAREILGAGEADSKLKPAAQFYLARAGDPHQLTKDIGRLFLGLNIHCAQCHDHPIVPDYKQDIYYGIYAFLNRTYLFTDKNNQMVLAEKAEGDVSFQSVFDKAKVTKHTGPHVPGGAMIKEPTFAKGQEYQVAPTKGVRPIPKYSRRSQLPVQLARADNVQFKRNIANRLWALLMGRGLVHPVDLDHSSNPPSHPELLTLLADELAAHQFDLKVFLRELTLSQTYQRSSELPPGVEKAEPESFAVANLKPLSPEQLAWSVMQATGLTDAERAALGKKANEAALHSRLAGNERAFVATFSAQPGQPQDQNFLPTVEQALFVSNGPLLRSWLAPRPGNLTDRLGKLARSEDVAEELYLSVLTRRPSDEERNEVISYLKSRDNDRAAAFGELAWALLASTEFRFNH